MAISLSIFKYYLFLTYNSEPLSGNQGFIHSQGVSWAGPLGEPNPNIPPISDNEIIKDIDIYDSYYKTIIIIYKKPIHLNYLMNLPFSHSASLKNGISKGSPPKHNSSWSNKMAENRNIMFLS